MKIIIRGRQPLWVAFLSLLCYTNVRAQFVWDITDSTQKGDNYHLIAISCSGENCTACGSNLDLQQLGYHNVFKRTSNGGRTWIIQDPGLPLQLTDHRNF